MEIVQDGSIVLRTKAKEVSKSEFGGKELSALLSDMEKTLDGERDGVALAAPQVGHAKRIFIVRYDRLLPPSHTEDAPVKDIGIYINPELLRVSRRKDEVDEGCLSVRGTYGKTMRHERATVKAQDENGAFFERGGGGVLAQAFQHEIDHLNGILFTDHAVNLREISHEPYDEA
jgi:peptide deformylase